MAEGGENQIDVQRRKQLHSPRTINKNINNDKGISEDGINQTVSLSSIDKRRRIAGVSRKRYEAVAPKGYTADYLLCAIEDASDVWYVCEVRQEGNQVSEFRIVGVVEPR